MTRQEAKMIAQEMLKLQANKDKPKVKRTKEEEISENRAKSEKWFLEKMGLNIVERNLKVVLPTKAGNVTYEAVKFENGRIGVYLKSGFLKYAWN
jgi:hypothetical protein